MAQSGYMYICIVDFLLVTDATENVGVQDVAFRGHELYKAKSRFSVVHEY